MYVVFMACLRRPYRAWRLGLPLIPGLRSSASGTRSHYTPGYNCDARTGLRDLRENCGVFLAVRDRRWEGGVEGKTCYESRAFYAAPLGLLE